jgi:hypothetical protein
MNKSHDDLTIDALLDDPLTRAVMRADRVDPSELRAMLHALAPLVARAAGRSNGGGRAGDDAPSGRNAFAGFAHATGRDGEASRRAASPQVCSAR